MSYAKPTTARDQVIAAAVTNEADYLTVSQQATYLGNVVGGRPSDAARMAVRDFERHGGEGLEAIIGDRIARWARGER